MFKEKLKEFLETTKNTDFIYLLMSDEDLSFTDIKIYYIYKGVILSEINNLNYNLKYNKAPLKLKKGVLYNVELRWIVSNDKIKRYEAENEKV